MSGHRGFIFLDRDGVINRKAPEGDYITSWKDFALIPGAKEAIQLLNQHGYRTFVVTNQRGIALRRLTITRLNSIHRRMLTELRRVGAVVDAIYYCPHDEGKCDCRKPKLGLFLRAKEEFPEIEFAKSVVIGDSSKDIEAGWKLGCKTILIAPETHEGLTPKYGSLAPDYIAKSLQEAVGKYILDQASRP